MNQLPIKGVYRAVSAPMGNLSTFRAFPTQEVEYLDPFLLLNHHGPQFYPPGNEGLPFGPHPHRGFETLTFILQGDIMHRDSSGGAQVIGAGGVQWMTAGKGLIHEEVSSPQFKRDGGMEEVIQVWMNLPSKYKMVNPHYVGLNEKDIPAIPLDDDRVSLHLVSGKWNGVKSPINSLTGLFMSRVTFAAGGVWNVVIEAHHSVLFYVVNGQVQVNGVTAETHDLVAFMVERSEATLQVTAGRDAMIIFGHGMPFNEQVIAEGPFVMNTEEEIRQAFHDYHAGDFGGWNNG